MPGDRTERVACLGSSTTAARGTYDWIAELARRPQNNRFRFLKFGAGGDLSDNAVKRTGRVVEARPDRVIVLIGSNDIMATVFPQFGRVARLWKGLSGQPSPARFRRNLEEIVARLQRSTTARIALSSLGPVGEDPHSTQPVQAHHNDLFAQYNSIIREVSLAHGTDYVPFYERFVARLEHVPGKPFTQFRFRRFYRDYLFREFLLHRSFDEIARMNGWEFHIDGVHLNSRGGQSWWR